VNPLVSSNVRQRHPKTGSLECTQAAGKSRREEQVEPRQLPRQVYAQGHNSSYSDPPSRSFYAVGYANAKIEFVTRALHAARSGQDPVLIS
jgi:hypothetical protein